MIKLNSKGSTCEEINFLYILEELYRDNITRKRDENTKFENSFGQHFEVFSLKIKRECVIKIFFLYFLRFLPGKRIKDF